MFSTLTCRTENQGLNVKFRRDWGVFVLCYGIPKKWQLFLYYESFMYLGECRQPPTRRGNNQLMANDLTFLSI